MTRLRTQRWFDIDWARVSEDVTSCQARILEAYKEGRHYHVAQLQNNLTRSFSARTMAVRRVTTNQGKKTPGVDNVLWVTPTDKWQAIADLLIDRKA